MVVKFVPGRGCRAQAITKTCQGTVIGTFLARCCCCCWCDDEEEGDGGCQTAFFSFSLHVLMSDEFFFTPVLLSPPIPQSWGRKRLFISSRVLVIDGVCFLIFTLPEDREDVPTGYKTFASCLMVCEV